MLNEGLKIVDPSSIRSDSNSKTKNLKKDILKKNFFEVKFKAKLKIEVL